MSTDRWNLRVWLRTWLNKPTSAEQATMRLSTRFIAELRATQVAEAEERLRQAKHLQGQRAAQA